MNSEKLLDYVVKNSWYRQGAGIIPFFSLPYVSMFGEVGPENVIVVQDKHLNLGYFGKNQEKQQAILRINKFLRNPKSINREIKLWRLIAKKHQNQLKQLTSILFKDDNVLKECIKEHINLTIRAWTPTLLIEDLDPWGEMILREYTNKYQLLHTELAVLTGPNKYSYVQQERIDRFKIAQRYRKKAVENHYKKYYWILSSWESAPRTDVKYFDNLIRKDRVNLNKAKIEVIKIQNHLKNEIQQRKKIYGKYKFDSKTVKILRLFNLLSDWRDERKKECMAKINYILARFLEKLAEFNKVSVELLEYIHVPDLESYKLSSDFLKVLKKRQSDLYVTYGNKDHNLTYVYGDSAKNIAKSLEKQISSDAYELTGRSAYPGVTKGKVKIINSISEFNKMKKGDVLVSIMTRPDLLPAIRMAKAIVTDEGGITCHAAIISRELKIPCIVGTQSATSKFKDGDLVSVDADKGIVRKI